MCSIIGYSGNEIAAPIIVKGLKRMEYRGYDSVGVATESKNQIELKKGIGKVSEVNSKIQFIIHRGRRWFPIEYLDKWNEQDSNVLYAYKRKRKKEPDLSNVIDFEKPKEPKQPNKTKAPNKTST